MDNKEYQTKMHRTMMKNLSLFKIIENIEPIDYSLICNGNNVTNLRNKIKSSNETKEKENLESELSKLEPTIRQKYVILSEEICRISEELNLDLGINYSFPFIYNGAYWELISKEILYELLATIAEKSGIKKIDARQVSEIKNLYEQFVVSASIQESTNNKETVKINLLNGTFKINSEFQQLEKPNSQDFIKYQLQFNYDISATAPLFNKFLDKVLPDKINQIVLSEYLGYIFARSLKLEKCLLIYGDGANGKSVLFDIVSALLGEENICSYTLSNLCDDSGYYRSNLSNKILNYSSEIGAKNCSPDTIKKLISNEPISARSPYGKAFELRDYCKFMFNVNILPRDTEQTSAYFRRFLIIKFGVTIEKEFRDPDLAKKIIKNELSGIFNWVLEGLKRIVKQRNFSYSKSIDDELAKFKKERNSVELFLEDCSYKPSIEKYQQSTNLYRCYANYCLDSGYVKVSSKEFSNRLENLGYTVRKKCTNNETRIFCEIIFENNDKETQNMIDKFVNNPKN